MTAEIAIGQTIHVSGMREYVSSAEDYKRRSTICTDVDGQGVLDFFLGILKQRS